MFRSNHTQTGDHKFVVNEGEDALMPCTLKKISVNDTVLWRRASTNEVLTAGSSRVTADKRIKILHDKRKYTQFFPFICSPIAPTLNMHVHKFFIFICAHSTTECVMDRPWLRVRWNPFKINGKFRDYSECNGSIGLVNLCHWLSGDRNRV